MNRVAPVSAKSGRRSGKAERPHRPSQVRTVTAAVWRGGDVPAPPGGAPRADGVLCDLLSCLLEEGVVDGELTFDLASSEAILGVWA